MKTRVLFVAVLAFLVLPAAADSLIGPDPTRTPHERRVSSRDVAEDNRLCPKGVISVIDAGTSDHLPLKWKTYCFGIRSLERRGDDFIATPLASMTSWSDRLVFNRRRVAVVVDSRVRRYPFLHATLRWHGVMDYPEDAILYVRTKAERDEWEALLCRPVRAVYTFR